MAGDRRVTAKKAKKAKQVGTRGTTAGKTVASKAAGVAAYKAKRRRSVS